MRYTNLILVTTLALLQSGCFTRPKVSVSLLPTKPLPLYSGIPNFGVVNAEANVYRGGQPTTKEQWEYIQKHGIKVVLKLNTDSEGSDTQAELIGIKVIRIPIPFEYQVLPGHVPIKQIEECLRTNQMNLYIHCEHGEDRTGVACMIYGVDIDKQPKDSEIQNMLSHGFHKELLGLWLAAKNY